MQVPPHLVAEILSGRLVTHPRPAPRHAVAGSSLGDELVGPFQKGRGGPGGWWILDDPEVHLDADVLVPDIAGWRRERMPTMPETAWLGIAPDWALRGPLPLHRPRGPGGEDAHLRTRRGQPPLAGRPGSAHPGGLRPGIGTLGPAGEPPGRRPGRTATLRRGLDQSRGPLGLRLLDVPTGAHAWTEIQVELTAHLDPPAHRAKEASSSGRARGGKASGPQCLRI